MKNAGRTYVATKNTTTQVIAYYTLIAGDVHRAQVPGSISHGLGRHPIPVVVLARLAVDHRYQGKGLGSGLLKDALLRVFEASDIIGVRALLVHAKDERVSDFYQRFGFLQSPTDPLHLYLSLADITASLKQ